MNKLTQILDEFKRFAVKGNVMDLAVGVIIGSAFNRIVTSLVEDMIMPPIGFVIGGLKFDSFKLVLKGPVYDATGKMVADAVSLNYGNFFQVFFNFLIIAFSVFLMVKMINKLKAKQEKLEVQEKKQDDALEVMEVKLLREIRDALVNKK